jgi:hypothetical protein
MCGSGESHSNIHTIICHSIACSSWNRPKFCNPRIRQWRSCHNARLLLYQSSRTRSCKTTASWGNLIPGARASLSTEPTRLVHAENFEDDSRPVQHVKDAGFRSGFRSVRWRSPEDNRTFSRFYRIIRSQASKWRGRNRCNQVPTDCLGYLLWKKRGPHFSVVQGRSELLTIS